MGVCIATWTNITEGQPDINIPVMVVVEGESDLKANCIVERTDTAPDGSEIITILWQTSISGATHWCYYPPLPGE